MDCTPLIPRSLHRIIVGGYDPGLESQAWWQRFGQLHPGWDQTTWTDPDPSDWELGRLFSSCRSGAQVADLMRVELLWHHGGIYVDTDVEPLLSLEPLLCHKCFLGTEDGRVVTNSVIGAEPSHPALRAVMDRLLEYSELPSDFAPNQTTGPEMWTRVLAARDDVLILPRVCFYPYNPEIGHQRPPNGRYDRNAYCAHHWAGTWVDHREDGRSHNRLSQARNVIRAAVRSRVEPTAARVAARVIHRDSAPSAVFVGRNRLLVQTRAGFAMQIPADDLSLSLALHGTYDPAMVATMKRLVRPGDWVVDVGANVGFATLLAAQLVGPQGSVVAMEASPELANLVRENLELNYHRNARVLQGAVGPQDGTTQFHSHERFRGSSVAGGEAGRERTVSSGFTTFEAPLRRIDDLLPHGTPIRLVKINVKGGEPDVLSSMRELVNGGRVDYLLVETLRSILGSRWTALIEILRDYTDRLGARLSLPTAHDWTREIGIREIEVREEFPHLLIDFTHLGQC